MSRLPRGYLQLEYIQSTGTQYIDTLFAPNQDTKLEIYCQTNQTSYGGIAACDTAWQSNAFGVWCDGAGYGNKGTEAVVLYGSEPIVSVLDKNKLYKNGELIWTAPESTFQTTHTLPLMALKRAGAMKEYLTGKLYYCKLWDNGTLIRDYIPCVSPSGAVGLFDLVGREFYGNAGTGVFTAGPVVLPALPRGYKRLHYIQSSGTQYVDTGHVIASENMRVVMKFAYVAEHSSSTLFGSETSGVTGSGEYSICPYGTPQFFVGGSKQLSSSYAPALNEICTLDVTAYNGTLTDIWNETTKNSQTYVQKLNHTYSIAIFGNNTSGTVDQKVSMKLYSFELYDNGVPVRCFVPCINPSGEVGLYDAIFRKFYGNAGTGSFTGEEFPEAALPDGYQRVEYIESSGTQHIDTGVVGKTGIQAAGKFQPLSLASSILLGCYDPQRCYMLGFDGSKIRYGYVNWYTASMAVTANRVYSFEVDFSAESQHLKLDGTTYISSSNTTTFTNNYTMYAFAYQDGAAGAADHAKCRMYGLQIYDGGSLIRDYIPCVELATGKAGLYDLVNGTFSASAGSGAFIPGPVVNTGIYEEPEIIFLEYIESTGTQYLDTRFAPNQDTRIVCDYQIMDVSAEGWIFGYQKSWAVAMFDYRPYANGTAHSGYGTKYNNLSGIPVGVRTVVDKNKNVTTDGDSSVSLAAQTFQAEDTAVLFARRIGNQVDYFAAARVFLTKVYDDDTPIRDYLPARTSDGDVGLWDNVDGLFYPNAGTGVFLAGPEVEQTPSAPTGFTASVEGDKVTLRWDAKDEVLGYRVYRDGLLLADTTATEIEDTVVPFTKTGYAVTAYNDLGEGKAAELTVYFVPENPVLYLVTDRTAADVAAGNAKGIYTATDLNRVGYAMLYIADIVAKQGIDAPVTPKTDWTDCDWVDVGDAEAYLKDLATLRNAVAVMSTTPNPPADLEQFGFQQANDIEQILVDIHVMLSLVLNNLLYAGEIFAGEA